MSCNVSLPLSVSAWPCTTHKPLLNRSMTVLGFLCVTAGRDCYSSTLKNIPPKLLITLPHGLFYLSREICMFKCFFFHTNRWPRNNQKCCTSTLLLSLLGNENGHKKSRVHCFFETTVVCGNQSLQSWHWCDDYCCFPPKKTHYLMSHLLHLFREVLGL